AGKSSQRFFSVLIEVAALKHGSNRFFPLAGVCDSLQQGQVAEHVLCGYSGIDTELLRQVSKTAANFIFLLEHVDIPHQDAATVGLLQGSESSHKSRLTGSVWAKQAIHAPRDRERNIIKRLDAVFVSLGKISNLEFHAHAPFR